MIKLDRLLRSWALRKTDPGRERIDELKKSQSFCAYPFVQMSTVPNSAVRPCCFYLNYIKKENGDTFYVNKGDTFKSVWNSKRMAEIRHKMLTNQKDPNCQICYAEEITGKTSMRFRSFKEWLDKPEVVENILEADRNPSRSVPSARYLELKPGNLCNLKCRMCCSADSSQVEKELKELAEKYESSTLTKLDRFWSAEQGTGAPTQERQLESINLEAPVLENKSNPVKEWEASAKIWNEVEQMLPTLETLSLAGGEPSLLPGVHRLLDRAIESGDSRHIHVFFASNFTHIPMSLVKACTEFKMFEFIASIDGTHGVQEYIRYPSKWSEIDRNFKRIKALMKEDQTKILLNCTIQLYNILNYTDILDWLESQDDIGTPFFHHPFNLNILYHPSYLNINLLPLKARKAVIQRTMAFKRRSRFVKRFPELGDRLDLICKLMKDPLPTNYKPMLKQFWHFTHVMDEHRNQSLKESIPELYQVVEEEVDTLGLGDMNWLCYPLK